MKGHNRYEKSDFIILSKYKFKLEFVPTIWVEPILVPITMRVTRAITFFSVLGEWFVEAWRRCS